MLIWYITRLSTAVPQICSTRDKPANQKSCSIHLIAGTNLVLGSRNVWCLGRHRAKKKVLKWIYLTRLCRAGSHT